MATYDCFVRIWLPLTSALKPNTSSTGHFDIQINAPSFSFATKAYGSNSDAVTTRTYSNPVISYASDGVTVYDSANFTIPENCLMCRFQFTGDDAGIAKVIEWLETYCEYNANASTSDTHVYKEVSCLRSYNALNARESCSFFALRVLQTTDGILQAVQKICAACICAGRKTA